MARNTQRGAARRAIAALAAVMMVAAACDDADSFNRDDGQLGGSVTDVRDLVWVTDGLAPEWQIVGGAAGFDASGDPPQIRRAYVDTGIHNVAVEWTWASSDAASGESSGLIHTDPAGAVDSGLSVRYDADDAGFVLVQDGDEFGELVPHDSPEVGDVGRLVFDGGMASFDLNDARVIDPTSWTGVATKHHGIIATDAGDGEPVPKFDSVVFDWLENNQDAALTITSPSPEEVVADDVVVHLDHEGDTVVTVRVVVEGETRAEVPIESVPVPVDLGGVAEGRVEIFVELLDVDGIVLATASVVVIRDIVDPLEELDRKFTAGEITSDKFLIDGLELVLSQEVQAGDPGGHDSATGEVLGLVLRMWDEVGSETRTHIEALNHATITDASSTPTVIPLEAHPSPLSVLGVETGGAVEPYAVSECAERRLIDWKFGLVTPNKVFCEYRMNAPASLGSDTDFVQIRWLYESSLPELGIDSDGHPAVLAESAMRLWQAQALWTDTSIDFQVPAVHRGPDAKPLTIFVVDNGMEAYSSPFGVGALGHPIRISGRGDHLKATVIHELFHTFQWNSIDHEWDVIGAASWQHTVAFYESAANWGLHRLASAEELGPAYTEYNTGYMRDEFLARPGRDFFAYSGHTPLDVSDSAYAYFPALEWLDQHAGPAGPVPSGPRGIIQRSLRGYGGHLFGADPVDLIGDQIHPRWIHAGEERFGRLWPRMWTALYLLTDAEEASHVAGAPDFDDDEYRWAHFWGTHAQVWRDELDDHSNTAADGFGAPRPARVVPEVILDDIGDTFVTDPIELTDGGAAFVDVRLPARMHGEVRVSAGAANPNKYEIVAIQYGVGGHPNVCTRDGTPLIHLSDGERTDDGDGDMSLVIAYDATCPTMTVGLVHTDPNSGANFDVALAAVEVLSAEPDVQALSNPTIERSVAADGRPTVALSSLGEWAGSPGSYVYRWLRCDEDGDGCVVLVDERSSCYPSRWDDVGSTMRLEVQAIGESNRSEWARTNAVVVETDDFAAVEDPEVPFWFDEPGDRDHVPAGPSLASLTLPPNPVQHPGSAMSVALSGDGGVLMWNAGDDGVQTRRLANGEQPVPYGPGSNWPEFDESGRYVAVPVTHSWGPRSTFILVHDLACGAAVDITRPPTMVGSVPYWYHSLYPRLSADGRFVVYGYSSQFDAATGDPMPVADGEYNQAIYRFDRHTGDLDAVSVDAEGQLVPGNFGSPDLSDDGDHVVFWTDAEAFGADEATGGHEVVRMYLPARLHDVVSAGVPDRSPRTSLSGTQVLSLGYERELSISGDGSAVGFGAGGRFYDGGTTFIGNNPTTRVEGRIYRWRHGSLQLVNPEPHLDPAGSPVMSRDGAWFTYTSKGQRPDGICDLYLAGAAGARTRISTNFTGVLGDGSACRHQADISSDGQFVAFTTQATNLLDDDVNGGGDDVWIYRNAVVN